MKQQYTSSQKMILYFTLLFLSACGSNTTPSSSSKTRYELSKPDKKFTLPSKLKEISGMSTISEEKVACVQDEVGKIDVFNLKNEEVGKPIEFGENGDYEDLAVVNKDALVLRSDGVIFKIKNWESENRETIKFKTSLEQKNDAE